MSKVDWSSDYILGCCCPDCIAFEKLQKEGFLNNETQPLSSNPPSPPQGVAGRTLAAMVVLRYGETGAEAPIDWPLVRSALSDYVEGIELKSTSRLLQLRALLARLP